MRSLKLDYRHMYNFLMTYPMARRVRLQAMAAALAAAGMLSRFQKRRWFSPEKTEAMPTTPAIRENVTKKPVAAFPIGK